MTAGNLRTTLQEPATDGIVGDVHPSFREHLLHVAEVNVNRPYNKAEWWMISAGKRWRLKDIERIN